MGTAVQCLLCAGAAGPEIGEEITVPEEEEREEKKYNARKSVVKTFGSEKRKRVYSAAQKNVVETDILETALEPAFSH